MRNNFPFFVSEALAYMKERAPSTIKPSPSFHDIWMRALTTYRFNLIIAARDTAKTTLCTQLHLLWKLQSRFFDRNSPPILQAAISSSLPQGMQKLEGIKRMILNWDYLQPLYDARVEWAKQGIMLSDGSQIKVYGAGSEIRGEKNELLRFETINCDDIIPEKPQYSNQFYLDWFYGAVFPARDVEKGQVNVVGTIRDYDDILMKLWKTGSSFWRGSFPITGDIEIIKHEGLPKIAV